MRREHVRVTIEIDHGYRIQKHVSDRDVCEKDEVDQTRAVAYAISDCLQALEVNNDNLDAHEVLVEMRDNCAIVASN